MFVTTFHQLLSKVREQFAFVA